MFEIIRKGFLTGLGVALVTREKVMAATKRFVEEGKITQEEAEKFADEMFREGEKHIDEVEQKISSSIQQALDSLDVGSKKEFVALKERVENLEKRFAMNEDRLEAIEKQPKPRKKKAQ